MTAKNHPPAQRRKEESRVGIFWLLHDTLLTDCTPLSLAEDYGEFKIHSGNHISVWEKFQQNGTAPSEMEYEEAPRGRVMYTTRTRQFIFLADRCILKRTDLVAKIKKEMHLPKSTKIGEDSHYRCFDCLRRNPAE